MEWKTRISKSSEKETLIRGYPLVDLIGKYTFTEATFLVLKGELPNECEREMLDAIFVASIEHGINPPSAMGARIIASCGGDFNDALAAGLLAIAQHHGGAVERSALLLQNGTSFAEETVRKACATKKKLPGYGHKIYTADPRAQRLLELAKKLGFHGKHVEQALAIEAELEKQCRKKICLNIDGAVAAIISDMGFSWKMAQAFFIIPRIVGLSAHVHEEQQMSTTYRRLEEEDVRYEGPPRREVPTKKL